MTTKITTTPTPLAVVDKINEIIDDKLDKTGTAASATTLTGLTATVAELNKMDGVTATTAELNYVDGVTSNIQTQLNGKLSTSGKAASATKADTATTLSSTLPINKGGTNATTAANARTNLGLNDAIVGLSVNGKVITYTQADGGTGTITTQDTNSNTALVPNWNSEIAISNTTGGFTYTTPSNGFLILRKTSSDSTTDCTLYYGSSTSGKALAGLNNLTGRNFKYNDGFLILLIPVAKSETYYFVTGSTSVYTMNFIPARAVAI